MSIIAQNLKRIQNNIPAQARLVAVSKTKPVSAIQEAYEAGQRIFGENKVQELTTKYELLPRDIEWHMIGHLQSNKVKYIAPFVKLIHGVDSFSLLQEINKQGQKNNRVLDVLVQFHIAKEESKFGFSWDDAESMLKSAEFSSLTHVRVVGVMGMASFTSDEQMIRSEFRELKIYFDKLKETYFKNENSFREISMGMSGDYPIALEEGSTLVRIGSAIFGGR